MSGFVEAVSQRAAHGLRKSPAMWITLVAGQGVKGDAHFGSKVKHRYLAARDPARPNLRQVHLLHREILLALEPLGFVIGPGEIGENILTSGIDLMALPTGAVLRIGATVALEVTGSRAPCVQLDRFKPGLMAAMVCPDATGSPLSRAGIMTTVLMGGDVRPRDRVVVTTPAGPLRPLLPV